MKITCTAEPNGRQHVYVATGTVTTVPGINGPAIRIKTLAKYPAARRWDSTDPHEYEPRAVEDAMPISIQMDVQFGDELTGYMVDGFGDDQTTIFADRRGKKFAFRTTFYRW